MYVLDMRMSERTCNGTNAKLALAHAYVCNPSHGADAIPSAYAPHPRIPSASRWQLGIWGFEAWQLNPGCLFGPFNLEARIR